MIYFATANGDLYSCVRHDHSHRESGINTPCLACRREQKLAERADDVLKQWMKSGDSDARS